MEHTTQYFWPILSQLSEKVTHQPASATPTQLALPSVTGRPGAQTAGTEKGFRPLRAELQEPELEPATSKQTGLVVRPVLL